MTRKRLTQVFPWLLPIRRWSKKKFFYLNMALDKNVYAKNHSKQILPYLIYSYEEPIINPNSGHDIKYQYNKLENLKLASSTINQLLLLPGDVFSYWQTQKHNQALKNLKEGLVLIDDKIVYGKGGGLCQLSNLLFWVALNSPLTVLERHHHTIENIPNSLSTLDCCDATISEGWCDLKLKNPTNQILQFIITFENDCIQVKLYSDTKPNYSYKAIEKHKSFYNKHNKTFLKNDIYQVITNLKDNTTQEKFLIHNEVEIGYDITQS